MRAVEFKFVRRFYPRHHNFHHNIKVKVGRQWIELDSGTGSDDDVSVYRENFVVYVLAVNHGLPYVGLDIYDLDNRLEEQRDDGSGEPETILVLRPVPGWEAFLQGSEQVEDALGKRGTDLAPTTMIRRLLDRMV